MNNRMDRVNSQIKREISSIIDLELTNSILKNGIITVNKVDTSKDFSRSLVYISFLSSRPNENEKIVKKLNELSGIIRYKIAQKLQFRKTPEFIFKFDNSVEYGIRIDKLIKDIEKNENKE